MGHYLKSPKTGKFYYNPTIKRSTLLRDYQRTVPIRPMIAGKRRRTWERKPPVRPPPPPGDIYEYTLYHRYDFEARTYLWVPEGDDPFSKKYMRAAEDKIRYGLRRDYERQVGFVDEFWDAGFRWETRAGTKGVRRRFGDVTKVYLWEKEGGKSYVVDAGVGRT